LTRQSVSDAVENFHSTFAFASSANVHQLQCHFDTLLYTAVNSGSYSHPPSKKLIGSKTPPPPLPTNRVCLSLAGAACFPLEWPIKMLALVSTLCTKKKQRKKKKKKGRKVEQQQQCELCDRQKHGKISANDRFLTINFTLKLQLQMSINIVTNTYFQVAFRNAKKYCYK
jgi:hypothetical protein